LLQQEINTRDMQEKLLPDHDKHTEFRKLMDNFLELPHLE